MTYRYDLFISYAHRDNQPAHPGEPGWISAFHNELARLHRENGRPGDTIFYFDLHEIKSGQDWELNIKAGLRDSCLMLAFVSPNYFASEWCRKEWEFYTHHESARAVGREGLHPIYFVEVPQLEDSDQPSSPQVAQWLADLRIRQRIDFRPWFPEGLAAFRNVEVRQQLAELEARIATLRDHIAGPVESPGARSWHNEHFVGRRDEMRQLDHLLTSESFGVLTAVHGLPGIGKTAIAGEYAHAHASRYAGGRWLLPCEDKTAMELESRTQAAVTDQRPHPACLLILDNVDKPELLAVSETAPIPQVPWLHLLVTTRLGPGEMPQIPGSQFLAINELPEADALRLIEILQPGGKFAGDAERDAALWIVRALEFYTLEVEAVAVFLGTYPESVTCQSFKMRLEAEGLRAPQDVTEDARVGMRMMYREKRLSAVFGPMLDALTEEERFVLDCAALLPPDLIPLPWLKALAEEHFPALKEDRPGHPDAWPLIARRLLGRRLLTADKQDAGKERMARMHRSVQETLRTRDGFGGGLSEEELKARILAHAKQRVTFLMEGWLQNENRWEIAPLAALAEALLNSGDDRAIIDGAALPHQVATFYWRLGNYASASALDNRLLAARMRVLGEEDPHTLASMNDRATTLWSQGDLAGARMLMEQVLAVDTRVRGEEHPDTLCNR